MATPSLPRADLYILQILGDEDCGSGNDGVIGVFHRPTLALAAAYKRIASDHNDDPTEEPWTQTQEGRAKWIGKRETMTILCFNFDSDAGWYSIGQA